MFGLIYIPILWLLRLVGITIPDGDPSDYEENDDDIDPVIM